MSNQCLAMQMLAAGHAHPLLLNTALLLRTATCTPTAEMPAITPDSNSTVCYMPMLQQPQVLLPTSLMFESHKAKCQLHCAPHADRWPSQYLSPVKFIWPPPLLLADMPDDCNATMVLSCRPQNPRPDKKAAVAGALAAGAGVSQEMYKILSPHLH